MPRAISIISAADFASAFALRPHLYAWFLGAGASASSGIPTGYAMIRDFKKRIYCREARYSLREVDVDDPLWASRINDFLKRSTLLPPDGDPNEYSAAFEAVFPSEVHRRQYIDDAVKKGSPSFAHRVIAILMASRQLNCVFTTNFDQLVEQSATVANQLLPTDERAHPTVAAIDSSDRASRCLAESDWPLIAKLHGDYQSTYIKNTNSELEHQDEKMRSVLVEACKRFGLVVVGYSGRDASVMEALESVLAHPNAYPSGLYWVTSSHTKLLPAVNQFLDRAAESGVAVYVVECKTFDELAGDLISQAYLPPVLLEHVLQKQAPAKLEPVILASKEAQAFPVLRYTALLVDSIPTTARRIQLSTSLSTTEVRTLLKEHKCRAAVASLGREIAVFGSDAEVLTALQTVGAQLYGTIELHPDKDSWALGLIYDALARALAHNRPLRPKLKRTGHAVVIASPKEGEPREKSQARAQALARLKEAYRGELTGQVTGLGHPFQEGVEIKIEYIENRWWCGFEPATFIDLPRNTPESKIGAEDGEKPSFKRESKTLDWRRERWATKYNPHWARIVDAWVSLLTSTTDGCISAFGLTGEEGIDATFRLSPVTGWSRPAHHHPYFDRTK